jgi:hypothetical protein
MSSACTPSLHGLVGNHRCNSEEENISCCWGQLPACDKRYAGELTENRRNLIFFNMQRLLQKQTQGNFYHKPAKIILENKRRKFLSYHTEIIIKQTQKYYPQSQRSFNDIAEIKTVIGG